MNSPSHQTYNDQLLAELTPPERYRAARLLEQAAEFADHEWTQGAKARTAQGHAIPYLPDMDYGAHPPARLCAMGHIERVTGEKVLSGPLSRRLAAAVTREVKNCIPDWNDLPATTPEQVRQAFHQAAARLYKEAAEQALPELKEKDDNPTAAVLKATAAPAAARPAPAEAP